ncbi:hypothetical protein [Mesorhizobium sp. L-2-11]|uniref:hypothetical protein n=1 Tax=Mesorhizobium sp. L-2-11 TaxID=2744521 RepID=UPI001202A3D0|nr:hypothetical protein [Mesorhizobium sp. L-2-11]TIQ88990.1 MAG: hypothetical protein E5X44_23270 [Mesorhizobium sp.]BCH18840.1 hypothetical protein MesoLjLa_56910 [Mesorhizobium sp. L-2-11]
MNDKTTAPDKDGDKGGPSKKDREARLAEQLRANLQKRKAQSRSRRAGDADKRRAGENDRRPDGLGGLGETQKD